jgi:hypothetical protein
MPRLDKDDATELLELVKRLGVERVARIAAALTEPGRGNLEKLDSLLLLRMADLKRQRPDRTVHAIAAQVAKEFHLYRKEIKPDSLSVKLERDYKKNRHGWRLLLETIPAPSQEQIAEDLETPKSKGELRARARIVEFGAIPSSIDMFDRVLAEAGARGGETLRLVERLGRKRIEPMLERAAERMRDNPYPLTDPHWRGKIPQTFLDLIEPELESLHSLPGRRAAT